MLEVVRLGAGYTTAIQNLGKSDYQLCSHERQPS